MPCYPLGHWRFLVEWQLRFWYNFHCHTITQSVAEQPDRLLNAMRLFAWCFSWTEKINFFIKIRQRTFRFSVRLSDYFPNPALQNRQLPSPAHDSNPASRSPFTLNSRIPAFKWAQSRIPKTLLGTLKHQQLLALYLRTKALLAALNEGASFSLLRQMISRVDDQWGKIPSRP